MTTMKMTYHASVERVDRLAACVEYLGFNEFIYEKPDSRNPDVLFCITDTGIILIKGASDGRIITGYMASVKRLAAIYEGNIPQALYRTATRNAKRFPFLLTM